MAGVYLHELLYDYVYERIQIEDKVDIERAIKQARFIFPTKEVDLLLLYWQGVPIEGIAAIYSKEFRTLYTRTLIEQRLYILLILLEYLTGYKDKYFIQRYVRNNPTLSLAKQQKLYRYFQKVQLCE